MSTLKYSFKEYIYFPLIVYNKNVFVEDHTTEKETDYFVCMIEFKTKEKLCSFNCNK